MRTSEHLQMRTSEQAASLLAQKLLAVKDTDAVVVAISAAAMLLAASLARRLSLPLEALPCRVIRHPADAAKTIGSVTVDAVSCRHDMQDIPGDYVSHQLLLAQCAARKEYESYYARRTPEPFRNKTVILVDETVANMHPMAACLKSVFRQLPHQVIVATFTATEEAARHIEKIAGQFEFLDLIRESDARFYSGFTPRQEDRAKAILEEYVSGYHAVPGVG